MKLRDRKARLCRGLWPWKRMEGIARFYTGE